MPAKLNSQSGVSLVELMVVVLIIVIVVSIATMYRGSANEELQRQNGSRQLKELLERARFDSVKRRADGTTARPYAQVTVNANSVVLRTYNDVVNSNPSPRDQTINFAAGVIVAHYASGTLPLTITYNRRGEPTGDARFRVCNITCSNPTNATSDIVIVTPTGTVNLLSGGSTLPTFSNPTLTGSVNASDSINDDVVIP